jgi:hypothetical protein
VRRLGSPERTPEIQKKLIGGVHAEVGSPSIDGISGNEILLGLIEPHRKVVKKRARQRRNECVGLNQRQSNKRSLQGYAPWRLFVFSRKAKMPTDKVAHASPTPHVLPRRVFASMSDLSNEKRTYDASYNPSGF